MGHTNTDESKKIPLGSGDLYCYAFTGTVPADAVFETEANRLGHITGGASFEYKPTYYTAKDDLNRVHKTIVTEEEASLKVGLITWNTTVLNKLIATGTVEEKNGVRTLKVGGISGQNNTSYLFRFVNRDKVDGDTRVTILGSNEAGFAIQWAKDKEAAINPEIKAVPLDEDGTLAIINEEILSPVATASATGTSTASTGK